MPRIIETGRTILRPFASDDAEAAHSWFGDEQVMRHTPTGPDQALQATRDRIAFYRAHQAARGFSKWVIIERASGRPIGDAGLLDLPELGWIDLGFRLLPTHWRQGLATEVSSAWVRAAFHELNLTRLGAFAHPDNTASLGVLGKLGFKADGGPTIVMGMSALRFGLAAAPIA